MKVIKSAFLLILLISAGVARSAEGSLTESTVWTYGLLDTYSGFPSITSKTVYRMDGDTVINSKVYRKVMAEFGFAGGIREEGQKWFARHRYFMDKEILLYDFSAKLGDTINSTESYGYTAHNAVVTKVDSITLENGEKRKRMEVGFGYTWIEGIGDLKNVFAPIEPIPTCGIGCIGLQTMLVCFKQNNVVLYSDQTYCSDCCGYTSPEGLQTTNRSRGLQCLLSRDGMLEYKLPGTQVIHNAKLINLSGSTVWEARAGFENGGGRIPVSHLNHGIYLLSVRTNQGVVVQKVSL